MRVLVTGATGFVGRHVVAHLVDRGHEVIASGRSRRRAEKMDWHDHVAWWPLEIGASAEVVLPTDPIPDLLIHCAWSYLDDYQSLAHLEELLLPHYLLVKTCLASGVRRCLVTGTCLEYGLQEGALSEDLQVRPVVPYAVAKHVLRQMLEALHPRHAFELRWLRLFYLFGPGQRQSSLLAQLQTALAAGASSFPMSQGDQLRDYLAIETAAELICRVAEAPLFDGVVNICSGRPRSVVDLIRHYMASTGADLSLEVGRFPYPTHEPRNFWGDTTRLRRLLEGTTP